MERKNNIIRDASGKLVRLMLDRRVIVFSFFLLVSAMFWFLNALNKEYTTSLSYPVKYTNFPDKKIIVGELPSNLDLSVNAYGYTLVKYYVSRQLLPIVFDVNSFSLNKMPDTETSNFFIVSSVARTSIAGQLGADIDILDIRPDTLFFNFTEVVQRSIPVRPVLDLEFQRQFMVNGAVVTNPDSVIVSGPASIIDTMQFVPTQLLSLKALNESVSRTVGLPDYKMLEFSETRVLVNIPVEQFTEASMKIPLEVINLPDSLKMKTFPSDISVYYLIALTDYEKVNRQQFRAVVNYENAPQGHGRLEVRVLKQPEFIGSLRFSPLSVEFLIEK